ncbi:MAG: acyl-CoA dehydrogenase [Arenimonas sp.]
MPDPLIDRRHLATVLHDLCGIDALLAYPRYAHLDRAELDAVVDAAHALALAKFAPHNRRGDTEEPHVVDGRVRIVPEVGEALRAHAEAGFPAMLAGLDEGGLQLPYAVVLACDGLFCAANVATAGYAMLARGVANVIAACGSEQQRRRFLPALRTGRFLGTMCLSEPQAGSSLGDIATIAEPHVDGTWRLRGAKMWISGGEHELAENIVHLVLARTPGAPAGVRGLSLFVAPRLHVDAGGRCGERNDVRLAGLNHKLGQRGIVNTFLKFGEQGACVAELVGREGEGLAQMFGLMNEARLGVGMAAVMLASAGFRASLAYSRERRQGRPPEQRDPATPPVPIVEHADVRRLLLRQKAISEGGFALAIEVARLVDVRAHDADADTRRDAGLLLDFLTPVVKAWAAQWGCVSNDAAIQVLGGYGYTREFPVEQYWRDNRLNPIHEGANGIQAIDLLGRKLAQADGAGLRLLLARIDATVAASRAQPSLQVMTDQLADAAQRVAHTAAMLGAALARGEPRRALADASLFLDLVGHLCLAWTWLRLAVLAEQALKAGAVDTAPHLGRLAACRHVFAYELPPVFAHAKLLQALAADTLDLDPDWL